MSILDRHVMPDPEAPSAQVFRTKAEARRYVRSVVVQMIENEIAHYGRTAEGWFLGDVHDPLTRKLITEAAKDFAKRHSR